MTKFPPRRLRRPSIARMGLVLAIALAVVAEGRAQDPEVFPGAKVVKPEKRASCASESPAPSRDSASPARSADDRARTGDPVRPKAFSLLDKLQNVRSPNAEAQPAPPRDALD